MRKITNVNVEHDGQAWFGTDINVDDPTWALDQALIVIRNEALSSPGKVTRVEFTYEGDEDA
jgi:hypothetical protein